MNPYVVLQNVALLGAAFAIYWLTETWWGLLLMLWWLTPVSKDS